MGAFETALQLGTRTYHWLRGRRRYGWNKTPPHRALVRVAARLRGRSGVVSHALLAVALSSLRFRERLHARRRHFGYEVSGAMDAMALRELARWQHAILTAHPEAPFHVNVHVRGDPESVQLDRASALLLMSEAVGSVNLFFGEASALDARTTALTLEEERRGWGFRENDLALDHALDRALFDSAAWSRIFSIRTGFERGVNNYLKLAHPGVSVVAMSLPEDGDGFADASLPAWLDAIAASSAPGARVRYVLLNRFGAGAMAAAHRSDAAITFAAEGGLSFAETLFLARKADAYVGPLDILGLAARTAGVPGVYATSGAVDVADADRGIVAVADLDPRAAVARALQILRTREGSAP